MRYMIIIKATAERNRTELIAKAQADAQRIRGEGESTAAGIYAAAYSRNPEFYSFYRSMEAYRSSFRNKSDVMVVEPNSDFFRYLRDSAGKGGGSRK